MGMGRRRNTAVKEMFGWVRRQSAKVKAAMAVAAALTLLLALRFLVTDLGKFFVAAESVHLAGIVVLIYKLTVHNTCSGLSLKTQELTAIFLAARSACSIVMEGDIHTILDFTTLVSTLWVVYMIRFKLKSSYIKDLDTMPLYYVVVPCAILAVLIHPHASFNFVWCILFAFSLYAESVSVLPQLRHMQNAKIVEPFTAHYVFALGVERFLSCAHTIIQVYETRGAYFYLITSGYLWFPAVLLAELIQTFILADFCYYYVKSLSAGQLVIKMPPV